VSTAPEVEMKTLGVSGADVAGLNRNLPPFRGCFRYNFDTNILPGSLLDPQTRVTTKSQFVKITQRTLT
jgi:hypothetical protein